MSISPSSFSFPLEQAQQGIVKSQHTLIRSAEVVHFVLGVMGIFRANLLGLLVAPPTQPPRCAFSPSSVLVMRVLRRRESRSSLAFTLRAQQTMPNKTPVPQEKARTTVVQVLLRLHVGVVWRFLVQRQGFAAVALCCIA